MRCFKELVYKSFIAKVNPAALRSRSLTDSKSLTLTDFIHLALDLRRKLHQLSTLFGANIESSNMIIIVVQSHTSCLESSSEITFNERLLATFRDSWRQVLVANDHLSRRARIRIPNKRTRRMELSSEIM